MFNIDRPPAKGVPLDIVFRGLREVGEERPSSVTHGELNVAMAVTDVATILIASVVARAIQEFQSFDRTASLFQDVGFAGVVAILFVLWMKGRGIYRPLGCPPLLRQITNICVIWTSLLFLFAMAAFAMNAGNEIIRRPFVLFAGVGLLGLVWPRILWREAWQRPIGARPSSRKVILLTEDGQSKRAIGELEALGVSVQHHFTFPAAADDAGRFEEIIKLVIACVRECEIEEIVVAADPRHWDCLPQPLGSLRVLPLPVYLIPVGAATETIYNRPRPFGDGICLELQRAPLNWLECALKRTFDIAIASVALVGLSPLFLAVVVGIKLDSPGPILFRQMRTGFNGKTFCIYKFRTMSVLENGNSVRQVSKGDIRITRLGRWLRRASIDELPQLLNVLKGEMSFVGPRPHAELHDVEFSRAVANYAFRQRMKPGLTGWAQIHGFRGPTPDVDSIRGRVEHDIWYIDHWSVWLDILIVLGTAFELARGRNAL